MESTFTPLGRMRRTDYAVNLGVINLAMIGVSTVVEEDSGVMGILRSAMMLSLAWLLYCSMARRLHDAGRTSLGAAVLLGLVAIGGILTRSNGISTVDQACIGLASIIGLYVLVAPRSMKAARFGSDPRSTNDVGEHVDEEKKGGVGNAGGPVDE